MGFDCLSTVSILRCERFRQIQSIALLIPTIIEVIFSTALIFTNRSSGNRRHLWITAEGWIYFTLTLIEVISHGVPAGRMNQTALKGLDIFIGATSVLPLFCYMFFILLFLRADFVDNLPARYQAILKVLLVLFIPVVAAFSELASFLGICYRVGFPDPQSSWQLIVGFRTDRDRVVWTFFTSFTLALLTIYQAMSFCLAFYRLAKVFLDQRQIEATEKDEAHHFRGIAWITAAFKLGAIETTIGFADMGFGSSLLRRILRMFARAFLCIGIARGVDTVEDFEKVREEMKSWRQTEFRRSRIQNLISNPRLSTFRQLTPTATAFHAAPKAPQVTSSLYERYAAQVSDIPADPITEVKRSDSTEPSSEMVPVHRVTVNYNSVGTPQLRLDFKGSPLELPPLPFYKEESEPPPISVWSSDSSPQTVTTSRVPSQVPSQAPSVLSTLVLTESGHETQLKSFSPVSPTPAKAIRKYSRHESSYSVKSSDTISAVRELTSQFPALPHSNALPTNPPVPPDFWDDSSVTSPKSSASDRPQKPQGTSDLQPKELSKVRPLPPVPILRAAVATSPPSADESNALQRRAKGVSFLDVSSSESEPIRASPARASQNPAEWIDYESIKPLKRKSILRTIVEGNDGGEGSLNAVHGILRESSASMNALHISWIKGPSVVEEERRQARKAVKMPQIARIKSVGSAPLRTRPSLVRREYTRGSLHLQPIAIPPNDRNNTEIIQGSLDSVAGASVLRDSEVLGIEDGRYSRQMREKGYF